MSTTNSGKRASIMRSLVSFVNIRKEAVGRGVVDGDDEAEAWLARLDFATGEEQLMTLLSEGAELFSEWVWQLAGDVVCGRVDPVVMAWVHFRAEGRSSSVLMDLDLEIDEDLEALDKLYSAAATDCERYAAIEASYWGVNLLEHGNEEALQWFTTREFVAPVWRSRYLSRFLASGYCGTELIKIIDRDIEEYVTYMAPLLNEDSFYLGARPDPLGMDLGGADLVHRALWEGREDVRWRVAEALPASEWARLMQLYNGDLDAHPIWW